MQPQATIGEGPIYLQITDAVMFDLDGLTGSVIAVVLHIGLFFSDNGKNSSRL